MPLYSQRKLHKTLSSFLSCYFVLISGACSTVAEPQSTITLPAPSTPVVEVWEGPDFDCWNSSSQRHQNDIQHPGSLLLLVNEDSPSNLDAIYKLDLNNGFVQPFIQHVEIVYAFDRSNISPNNQSFWYLEDQGKEDVLWLFDLTSHGPIQIPYFRRTNPTSIDWSPDGSCLFIGEEGWVYAYETRSGRIQKKAFEYIAAGPFKISSTGKLWTCHASNAVCVMNTDGKRIQDDRLSLPQGDDHYLGEMIGWSFDGNVLAVGLSYPHHPRDMMDIIRIIVFEGEEVVGVQDIHRESILYPAWSPVSRQLLLQSEKGTEIYDLDSGTSQLFVTEDREYAELAWMPDGQLAYVLYDYATIVLAAPSGEIRLRIRPEMPASISNVAGLP